MDNSTVYFLKRLLQDTLSLNFNYYIPPFGDLSGLDIGLRKGLNHSEELYQNLKEVLMQAEHDHFYLYSDRYLINYIFFILTRTQKTLLSPDRFYATRLTRNILIY